MKEIYASNYLAEKIDGYNRKIMAGTVITLASLLLTLVFPSTFIFFIIGLIYTIVQSNSSASFRSGFAGEEALRERLRRVLPEGSTLVHNLKTPCGDIDCLAVTPAGLYAFEIKNHKGDIFHDGKKWYQVKTGRGGTRYVGQLRNPSGQLIGTIRWLSERLREDGINLWVNGMVVFTNPYASVHVGRVGNIGVARLDSVSKDIFSGKEIIRGGLSGAVENCLLRLAK
jgi:hypothetical protein